MRLISKIWENDIYRIAIKGALLFAISLIIEVVCFGFHSIESISYIEVHPKEYKYSEIVDLEDAENRESDAICIEYIFDSDEINNIHFTSENSEARGSVRVFVKDEGHKSYYLLGKLNIHSEYFARIHPYGDVDSIMVVFEGGSQDAFDLEFNVPQPFNISKARILAFFAILAFVTCIICRSKVFDIRITRRFIILAAFIFACMAVAIVVMRHIDYGEASVQHHEYHNLAVALSHGQLYLDELPSQELMQLQNPYDTNERAGVYYLWDHAYFKGRYYVYFGLLPVLLYHLPYYALTGGELPEWVGVAVSAILFVCGACYLVWILSKRKKDGMSRIMAIACMLVILLGSFIVFGLVYSDIYSSAIVLGLALTLWGISLWMRAIMFKRTRIGCGVLGSLCMAAVVLCRPQLLIYSIIGPALLIIAKTRLDKRITFKSVLLFLLPYVLVFAVAGFYNFSRFGSCLDFGASYNLTTNDMTHRSLNVDLLWQGLFAYLVQPPAMVPEWPFIVPAVIEMQYFGEVISENTYGGIFFLCPILLTIPIMLLDRTWRREAGLLRPAIIVFLVAGCVLAGFDALGAGVLQRYYLDFGLAFSLAALFAYAWDEGIALHCRKTDVRGTLFCILLTVSLVNQVLLFFMR